MLSAMERLGGLQIPTSGCAASSLVKSRRLCLYPTQGGFRCVGVIGPNSNTRWALCMICACTWWRCCTPWTPHHACNLGKRARWNMRYSWVCAVPAIVARHPSRPVCLKRVYRHHWMTLSYESLNFCRNGWSTCWCQPNISLTLSRLTLPSYWWKNTGSENFTWASQNHCIFWPQWITPENHWWTDQAATDVHPICSNKKKNHLQNSLLRRAQFWARKTFSKLASLKRASPIFRPYVSKVCADPNDHGLLITDNRAPDTKWDIDP